MTNYDARWMAEVVAQFEGHMDTTPAAIAQLARQLAESGTIRRGRDGENDVASTGGPGSLTTFLCPLIMVADGCRVPKIGVPGRPAGVVDALATIPGYRVSFDRRVFEQILERCGFANALADSDFAPADRSLFAFRQQVGAQAVPGLVAASLLAKKVAVGLTSSTIDVRVGAYGNFGQTKNEAQRNVELLRAAGQHLGIRVTTALTFSSGVQPYLGRHEALKALTLVVTGAATGPLANHFRECVSLARRHDPRVSAKPVPSSETLWGLLDQNLRAQGASGGAESLLLQVQQADERSSKYELVSPTDGFVSWDFRALRSAIVTQQRLDGSSKYPDTAGVELRVMQGEQVRQGDVIALVRHTQYSQLARFAREILDSVTIAAQNTEGTHG